MIAEKMFEELGFSLHIDYELCKTYKTKHDKNGRDDDIYNWDYVYFYKDDKTYNVDIMINDINIELHKAIHQQLIELGWIK